MYTINHLLFIQHVTHTQHQRMTSSPTGYLQIQGTACVAVGSYDANLTQAGEQAIQILTGSRVSNTSSIDIDQNMHKKH